MTSKFDLLITAILSAIFILVLAYSASATITWYDNYPDCTTPVAYTTDTVTNIQVYAGTKAAKDCTDHADWFWFAPGVPDDSPTGGSETYLDELGVKTISAECCNVPPNDGEGYSGSHPLPTPGVWNVHVYFYSPDEVDVDDGTTTVTSEVPEFPFSPAIVIVLSGSIYFVMRKRIKIDRG